MGPEVLSQEAGSCVRPSTNQHASTHQLQLLFNRNHIASTLTAGVSKHTSHLAPPPQLTPPPETKKAVPHKPRPPRFLKL